MEGEMVMSGAMRLKVVTIDGPSGVGKSTVSRKVAAALGWTYLDTGAMYRAVGFQCRQAGIALADSAALNALLAQLDIRLLPPLHEGDDVRVFLHDEDISAAIRSPEAGMMASQVSALSAVRSTLTALQQKMGRAGEIVAEGRDTGTVVFPAAAWKFYLDAPPEERCRRRVGQLRAKGQTVADEAELLNQIIERDRNDRERTIAPLRMAEDAVLIDASDLTADEVAEKMLAAVRAVCL
ncbi:MAG: (d)CMP kinase [Candidatus Electronema sp. V4]|uniref:(d)CMP kinase n=1 Tax=Candidatus Electronema sp. V4 TaxID=3454756 RepID=UPI004055981F